MWMHGVVSDGLESKPKSNYIKQCVKTYPLRLCETATLRIYESTLCTVQLQRFYHALCITYHSILCLCINTDIPILFPFCLFTVYIICHYLPF